MKQGIKKRLSQWYATPLGKAILKQEQSLVDQAIKNLFGYFLVQLESPCHLNLMANSRIQHKLLVASEFKHEVIDTDSHSHFLQADLDYLPIASECIDLVLLPHTLEVAEDPYYLLREVDRILVAEGHVVITGFNPYGCLMMRQRWFKRQSHFKQVKLERLSRVQEWLEVLGYDIELKQYSTITCFAQRETRTPFMSALEWFEKQLSKLGLQFGNVYCLVAKKRVDAPTLVGSTWRMPRWQNAGAKGVVSLVRNQRKETKEVIDVKSK